MIVDTITAKIGEAMKAKEETRLSTLRMLSSALNYEKIAKQHDLNEQEEIVVVRREGKKRKDAIEALEQAKQRLTGHTEEEINQKIDKEKKELEILGEFLPPEMDESELQKIIDEAVSETGASSMSDMGRVIAIVMAKVAGKTEGSRVSQLVKSRLG